MGQELDSQVRAAEEEWFEDWKKGPQKLAWSSLPPQVGDKAPTSSSKAFPDSRGMRSPIFHRG